MRLPSDPRLPGVNTPNFLTQLTNLYRDIAKQLNLLTEGSIEAVTNKATAAPTAGVYQIGDFVKNSAPAEAGTAGSKYIITGWICTASPLTFKESRVLTGN